MKDHYSARRKIDPSKGAVLGDGTPNDADRVEIGPTRLAREEWARAGLVLPNLSEMRRYRLDRLVSHIVERDLAGLLVFDPLNIRYATDSSNMHLWIAHNPARAAFVAADGYVVLWDFHRCEHLSGYLPLIDEIRREHSTGDDRNVLPFGKYRRARDVIAMTVGVDDAAHRLVAMLSKGRQNIPRSKCAFRGIDDCDAVLPFDHVLVGRSKPNSRPDARRKCHDPFVELCRVVDDQIGVGHRLVLKVGFRRLATIGLGQFVRNLRTIDEERKNAPTQRTTAHGPDIII